MSGGRPAIPGVAIFPFFMPCSCLCYALRNIFTFSMLRRSIFHWSTDPLKEVLTNSLKSAQIGYCRAQVSGTKGEQQQLRHVSARTTFLDTLCGQVRLRRDKYPQFRHFCLRFCFVLIPSIGQTKLRASFFGTAPGPGQRNFA